MGKVYLRVEVARGKRLYLEKGRKKGERETSTFFEFKTIINHWLCRLFVEF